jgi:hypothetical protein
VSANGVTAALQTGDGNVTPHSARLRRGVAAQLGDGRSVTARFARNYQAELVRHVGAAPSFVEQQLIQRAVWLALQLQRLNTKIAEGAEFSDIATRQYLAWSNSLRRTLRELGLKGAAAKAPNLVEIMATQESTEGDLDIPPYISRRPNKKTSPVMLRVHWRGTPKAMRHERGIS